MQKKNRGFSIGIVSVCLVALLLSGCGKGPETAKTDQAKSPTASPVAKVSVGVLKLTSSAPIFIGMEKGFFKEQGIDINPEWFDAAHPIAVATASNKVQVGATGITASLFNMVAGGQSLSIVADKGREQKGYSSSAVLMRTDLWENGAKKIEDLKGKRVGITQTGSTFHYMLGRLLETKGLALSDVEIVPLGKLSALMAALQGKQVDAVILNEPNITKVEKAGYGKVVVQVGDASEYQTSAIFFAPEFMKNKEVAVRFLAAYIKATRYYYDAVLKQNNGKPAPGANYDEVVGIIAKHTGAPIEDVKLGLPYMDREGKLLAADMQTQIDWYFSHKMIEKPMNASQVMDSKLWEEAVKKVGAGQ
jgi:NitT/TauT family transport system substrate-binding protein